MKAHKNAARPGASIAFDPPSCAERVEEKRPKVRQRVGRRSDPPNRGVISARGKADRLVRVGLSTVHWRDEA